MAPILGLYRPPGKTRRVRSAAIKERDNVAAAAAPPPGVRRPSMGSLMSCGGEGGCKWAVSVSASTITADINHESQAPSRAPALIFTLNR